jgi:hypothetical protein
MVVVAAGGVSACVLQQIAVGCRLCHSVCVCSVQRQGQQRAAGETLVYVYKDKASRQRG